MPPASRGRGKKVAPDPPRARSSELQAGRAAGNGGVGPAALASCPAAAGSGMLPARLRVESGGAGLAVVT
jgi:hypothetical protein